MPMSETRALASYVVSSRMEDIPEDVRHEARRALVNYVGCAVGGSPDRAVELAIRALGPYSGPPTASVLGRADRLDPLHASLMNGISSHVYDYDDTTPANYLHPTSPVASALFAYASAHPVSGRDFLHAFIMGFEAESRVGNAVYPAHYDAGWHITGTAGVFGAAAAVGRLLGLSLQEMIWAVGLAATQAAGLREMFGSMAKSFHPGRAAQNGYAAALLAQAGFTAGERGIEGPRGFAAVQAARFDLTKITAGLGADFSLRVNTYKPFPCGIVIHPTIDGCHPAARRAPDGPRGDPRRPPPRRSAGPGSVQPAGHRPGAPGEVLRLPRRGRWARPGQGRHRGVHRRGGQRSGRQAGAGADDGRGRSRRSARTRRMSTSSWTAGGS